MWSALVFFFNDTATTEIYTLSLHDALPICLRMNPTVSVKRNWRPLSRALRVDGSRVWNNRSRTPTCADRKSTRLNSSHANISYAVFCLKKKKKKSISYQTHNE